MKSKHSILTQKERNHEAKILRETHKILLNIYKPSPPKTNIFSNFLNSLNVITKSRKGA